jgi:signal transduction histidine kinase
MGFSKRFGQQSRAQIFVETILALAVIGVLDFITSYRFRLLPFYAGPIFVAAWFCGKKSGVLIALLSALVWWCANYFGGDPDLRTWIWMWEMSRHLGSFLVVAWIASVLRSKSDIAAARIELLEHSQRLEHEIVNIAESEQRRIGQDLHDGLCQYLAALNCSATSLRDDLKKLNLLAEATTAAELAKHLQQAVVQTRDLSRELVPAHISQSGGVGVALESLAQSVSRLHGISCSFRREGPWANCSEQTAMHLYRIAQEAINNATKHGKARKIDVSLAVTDGALRLRISDDGVGISEARSNGMGLAIMRYRARLNGGELKIERSENGGTTISCSARINPQTNEIAGS